MKTIELTLNEKQNVTLTAYLQNVAGEYPNIKKRPSVLILPGGGYKMCSEREADPVAFPYLKAGFQVFILRYSVGMDIIWPEPLEDYEQAMELIKSNAEEWNLYTDKIAVIGFSAGGHLASVAATMAKNRPNAAIMGYPVTLDEYVRMSCSTAPDTTKQVDSKTCPCFIFAARSDDFVPVENSIEFLRALIEKNIAFESHIYGWGPHGFATGDSSVMSFGDAMSSRIGDWVEDSIDWLREVLGDFSRKGGLTQPLYPGKTAEDEGNTFSVECSLKKIFQNPDAITIFKEIFQEAGVDGMVEQASYMPRMTFGRLLKMMNISDTLVQKADERLMRISNDLQ